MQGEPVLQVGGQGRQGGARCPLRARRERVRRDAAPQKQAVLVQEAGSRVQVLPEEGEEVRGLHDEAAD